MTLDPNFVDKAFILIEESGGWKTSLLTPPEMIDEIKRINKEFKITNKTDKDLIKIIDYEKEYIEDYNNDEKLQKLFNYDIEAFKKNCIKIFREN